MRAGVDADLAQRAIERHHAGENLLRDRAALRDFLEDALVNQIVKLRHDGKRGDVALAQRSQQFGRVERFQIDDARSLDQRQQQVRHLRQNVEERQHAEQGVGRAKVDPVEDGLDFAQKIGVSQHHALGVGGGAGGVEQGSEIVTVRGGGLEIAGAALEDGG